jgi:2'-5' RNA ligase
MMDEFTYADPSAWEEWQAEYRFGAFFIFPPAGTIEPVDDLRRAYDPRSASYCQAHISLSEPLAGPLTSEQCSELQAALSSIAQFELHYGTLRTFPPYPGVTYAIQPEDRFMQLRSAIHATTLFSGVPLIRKDRAPHLTIAEFISWERTEELFRELNGKVPEGTFLCGSIEYAVPNQDFYFERVLTLPLGG